MMGINDDPMAAARIVYEYEQKRGDPFAQPRPQEDSSALIAKERARMALLTDAEWLTETEAAHG